MLAIVDYGVGNLFSVEKACHTLTEDVCVTSDAAVIRKADRIVLPGVGAFGDCMHNLEATGLISDLRACVEAGTPLLGICVGLQILFEGSEESPGVPGLGIFKGMVRRIPDCGLKIPHMGWNAIKYRHRTDGIDLFKGLSEKPYVYFVHSYAGVPEDDSIVTAQTAYGRWLTASVARDNVMATQFHPEKSGDVGLAILKNFIDG